MPQKRTWAVLATVILSGVFLLILLLPTGAPEIDRKRGSKVLDAGSAGPSSQANGATEHRARGAPDDVERMTADLIRSTTADLERVRHEEALSDPARFASLARQHPMIYTEAVRNFDPQNLPQIYALLDESEHATEWRFIAQLIGFVSTRGNADSVEALLKYLQREDVWPQVKNDRVKSYDVGMGKMLCLEWMGVIGGEQAEKILLSALTPAGAEELAARWIHFTEVSYPGGRSKAIASIRGRAAMGLVFCQTPRALAAVERLYNEEKEECIQRGQRSSDLFLEMASAMAHKAYIDDNGIQNRLELYGAANYFEAIGTYVKRYMIE